MSPNDVQLMTVGYGTPFYEALKNHNVDAEVSFNGGIARAQMAGYAVRVLPVTPQELNQYSFNLFATQSFIEKNPDVIVKMGRAVAKATVFLMTNPRSRRPRLLEAVSRPRAEELERSQGAANRSCDYQGRNSRNGRG